MALFNFGKKKKASCGCVSSVQEVKAEPACACSNDLTASAITDCCCSNGECPIKSIKVLGSGCKSCHEIYEATKAAVAELGMGIEVEYITNMEKIAGYGVMSMPALVVNEKVVSMGKVLKQADIIKLFRKLGNC